MGKKIVIIGGGLAGLSAGIYGRLNGYETVIYELHSSPGGMCSGWERQGYTIDGCFHWWMGSGKESPFYHFFETMGVHPHTRMLDHDTFITVKDPDGETLNVYLDLDRFGEDMKRIAPEDWAAIEQTIEEIRILGNLTHKTDKARELMGLGDFFDMIFNSGPGGALYMKYSGMTIGEYAKRFSNNTLRRLFSRMFNYEYAPTAFALLTLGAAEHGDCGRPEGGASAFIQKIAKRYNELGGEIQYNRRVSSIITEKGVAKGVIFEDGSRDSGDWIISSADGYSTIFKMLEGRFVNKKIMKMYSTMEMFASIVHISIGVDTDLFFYPHNFKYLIEDEVRGMKIGSLTVDHFCADSSAAPEGKSLIRVLLDSPWEFWQGLGKDTNEYNQAKDEFAGMVIKHLENLFPEIKDKIEMIDVATPVTYNRYTDNYKGAYEGWRPTIENMKVSISKTLPGLKNFYMAGQWVEPGGGVPMAVQSGRDVLQLICKKDKIPFVAKMQKVHTPVVSV